MKTIVFSIFFMFISFPAIADEFYVLVGCECDKKNDQIVINYKGAYNKAGESMLANKSDDEWNPWELVQMKDDENIGSLDTISKSCKLSDGLYTIKLGPDPGNMNILGRCGAEMSAWAEIQSKKKIIYKRRAFEGDCHNSSGEPVITKIIVKAKSKEPEIIYTSYKEFNHIDN